jgi:hypothetical protein
MMFLGIPYAKIFLNNSGVQIGFKSFLSTSFPKNCQGQAVNSTTKVSLFFIRKGNGLNIPPGWLCYLAPEIIRSLRVRQKHDEEELPFTKASDVYAFG